MQNVGHHLVTAKRFRDLKGLLTNAAWLESKLHSYGVASVVADYRRWDCLCVLPAFMHLSPTRKWCRWCCLCQQQEGTKKADIGSLYTQKQPGACSSAQLRQCIRQTASLRGLAWYFTYSAWARLAELSSSVSMPGTCRYLMCVNDDQVKLMLETVQMSVSSCMQHPELPTLRPQMVGRLMAAHHSSRVAVYLHCACPATQACPAWSLWLETAFGSVRHPGLAEVLLPVFEAMLTEHSQQISCKVFSSLSTFLPGSWHACMHLPRDRFTNIFMERLLISATP